MRDLQLEEEALLEVVAVEAEVVLLAAAPEVRLFIFLFQERDLSASLSKSKLVQEAADLRHMRR